ncbi:MAG: NAD(P)/FAD-dependent oxidoreductase [Betaproteobacteria bacterium]|nr:NAD(P)/FAD-dependent oxidoreductase [Betaproteobacteria bacterium]
MKLETRGSVEFMDAASVREWLAQFERLLRAPQEAPLAGLFGADAHWRDLLSFGWQVRTVSSAQPIAAALARHAAAAGATGFEIDPRRTPPRRVTRAGIAAIEAFFRFETALGRGQGVLRLADEGRAWTLFTALDELKGHEERVGSRRPHGAAYSRDFRGPNWLDKRRAAATYAERDPAVLVVGGGHAGLSIAARLRQLGVEALVVDRNPRVGDNWRRRYHALTLHNQVQVNHLPYLPFPPNWPTYIPKDKLAGWFEAYVEAMELDFWTDTEFRGASYDERDGRWTAELRRADGETRRLRPRHIVMATGVSGIPRRPEIPGLAQFSGTVLHSHEYDEATSWQGRDAIVIGTGNSGHDIAQDLYSNGARITLVQRSPTFIVNIEPSAQLAYALYDEGLPTDDCDLIAAGTPIPVMRQAHRLLTTQGRALDRQLIEDLGRVGFKVNNEDPTGWQIMYLQRGGGYYFNVGCSDLIVERKIRLAQFADLAGFEADGARTRSGERIPADLVVLATGYHGLQYLVRQLFGDAVAERVGPVWGIDEATQELRNMWMPTGQPGLWFIAGSFAQCRIHSKYLALQIKAREERLV